MPTATAPLRGLCNKAEKEDIHPVGDSGRHAERASSQACSQKAGRPSSIAHMVHSLPLVRACINMREEETERDTEERDFTGAFCSDCMAPEVAYAHLCEGLWAVDFP